MIVAVVVTYHPDPDLLKRLLSSVHSQVEHTFIVDNASDSDDVLAYFDSLCSDTHTIVRLHANQGLAAAQNIGIAEARKRAATHVLLLDQDSALPLHAVSALLECFSSCLEHGIKLGCAGARPFSTLDGKKTNALLQRPLCQLGDMSIVRQVIASSMLIPMATLNDVGLMEERLFIDGVDHEWCWRAGLKGYAIAVRESVVLEQRFGDARGQFLGIRYKVGSPIRLYYQFRNILLLSRRGYVPLYWKVRHLLALPIRFVLMSALEKPRVTRARYMLKGLRDGVSGKTGAF